MFKIPTFILFFVMAASCMKQPDEPPSRYLSNFFVSPYLDSVYSGNSDRILRIDLDDYFQTRRTSPHQVVRPEYVSRFKVPDPNGGQAGRTTSCAIVNESVIALGIAGGGVYLMRISDGQLLKTYGIGRGPGEFLFPSYMVSRKGLLGVSDPDAYRITVFDEKHDYVGVAPFMPVLLFDKREMFGLDTVATLYVDNSDPARMQVIASGHDLHSDKMEKIFEIPSLFEIPEYPYFNRHEIVSNEEYMVVFSKTSPYLIVYKNGDIHRVYELALKHYADRIQQYADGGNVPGNVTNAITHIYLDGHRLYVTTGLRNMIIRIDLAEKHWDIIPGNRPLPIAVDTTGLPLRDRMNVTPQSVIFGALGDMMILCDTNPEIDYIDIILLPELGID